jgi:phosphoserine phosphatase
MLTLPLVGYDQSLIGVLQLLNKDHGVFDDNDERVAMALAAQCAVALHRVRLTQELMNRGARDPDERAAQKDAAGGRLRRRRQVPPG